MLPKINIIIIQYGRWEHIPWGTHIANVLPTQTVHPAHTDYQLLGVMYYSALETTLVRVVRVNHTKNRNKELLCRAEGNRVW